MVAGRGAEGKGTEALRRERPPQRTRRKARELTTEAQRHRESTEKNKERVRRRKRESESCLCPALCLPLSLCLCVSVPLWLVFFPCPPWSARGIDLLPHPLPHRGADARHVQTQVRQQFAALGVLDEPVGDAQANDVARVQPRRVGRLQHGRA